MFLVQRGELEGRLDAPFYTSDVLNLEKRIKALSTLKLSDFIQKMASGATPSVQEEAKYYSDKTNGIPFIRVQNLSPTNELLLDDLRYINIETHQHYLKRSQVCAGDLLVKITGVGRMAIASVAPEGFEGNTNQHLMVIKTKNRATSEVLATFLNTDIGEKLASRRATGGTRPALDYNALRSIPIVYVPESVQIIQNAIQIKQAKEAQAAQLLASIDCYLLEKLGITLPQTVEKKKTFVVWSDQVSGGRFDPAFYKPEYIQLLEGIRHTYYEKLSHLVKFSSETWNQKDYFKTDFPYIEISEINLSKGTISNVNQVKILEAPSRAKMIVRKGDLIISTTRPNRGAIAKISENEDFSIASTGFAILRHYDKSKIVPNYLHTILRHRICLAQMEQRSSGGNYPAITQDELGNLNIPIPSISVQQEIVFHLEKITEQVQQLETEAKTALTTAKAAVEKQILG
jgi:type I restriction enzyme, S subunit